MSHQGNPNHINKSNQQGGFTLPDGYFEQSQKQLLARINNGGFNIPDGYFEQNKTQLFQHIKPTPKRFALHPVWYAAAAIFMVSLGVMMMIMPTTDKNTENIVITDDEIINYVSADKLTDIPMEALAVHVINNTTDETITEEVIEGVDEETLLNEL